MTDLTKLLKETLYYDLHADLAKDERDEYGKYVSTKYYLSEKRLEPIHSALIECVAALEYYANRENLDIDEGSQINFDPTKKDWRIAPPFLVSAEQGQTAHEALDKLREVL